MPHLQGEQHGSLRGTYRSMTPWVSQNGCVKAACKRCRVHASGCYVAQRRPTEMWRK
ncbi:hypothetical protein BD309DRAFT_855996 [Dichomitus squalens]|uniref:Uncharacterized protein n=1 Tax=Dichomitus squalens (strain LYAD-421) TaxID=732165 RepID=R7SLS5_DICSQ|nr:uncharacterized protein DICSQDRAFT_140657 [Dichomitus squalens LYAD-421 SS1]EJF57106.1 hypothetical protein DICSQDRAFT_140657 [Dichomitus squalens LYAD-421 SS1]TBU47390.1 hypothetical protein BD309DRAFT_855996 [Dichomitus squalens]